MISQHFCEQENCELPLPWFIALPDMHGRSDSFCDWTSRNFNRNFISAFLPNFFSVIPIFPVSFELRRWAIRVVFHDGLLLSPTNFKLRMFFDTSPPRNVGFETLLLYFSFTMKSLHWWRCRQVSTSAINYSLTPLKKAISALHCGNCLT